MNLQSKVILLILPNNTVTEVYATVLDEFFAVCRNPLHYEEIWLLVGQDGAWYVQSQFDQVKLPGIIQMLKLEVNSNY